AAEREGRGAPDVLADLGDDGPPRPDRRAEVALERVGDEAPVLHEHGLVQVKLGPHAGHLLGRRHELGEHHLHGIARDEEQHAEDGERHSDQHRDDGEDPPDDPDQHADAYFLRLASLSTGYALKLYTTPCTPDRNAHTDSSSTRGTVSASSSA